MDKGLLDQLIKLKDSLSKVISNYVEIVRKDLQEERQLEFKFEETPHIPYSDLPNPDELDNIVKYEFKPYAKEEEDFEVDLEVNRLSTNEILVSTKLVIKESDIDKNVLIKMLEDSKLIICDSKGTKILSVDSKTGMIQHIPYKKNNELDNHVRRQGMLSKDDCVLVRRDNGDIVFVPLSEF